MSNENAPQEPVKKKGGALKLVLLSVLLLGAGGSGTYAAFASGMLDTGAAKKIEPQAGAQGRRGSLSGRTARRKTRSRSCMARAGSIIPVRFHGEFAEPRRQLGAGRGQHGFDITTGASSCGSTSTKPHYIAYPCRTGGHERSRLASIKGKEELRSG